MPAKTIIHVNSHRIRQNRKTQEKQPVITVKKRCSTASAQDTKECAPRNCYTNSYGYEAEILGACRVVYRPDRPRCGAQVWIETLYDVKVIEMEDGDSPIQRQSPTKT